MLQRLARPVQSRLLTLLLALKAVKAEFDTTCSAGYYIANWSTGGACQPCSPGNFCPGGAKINQDPCPQGTYTLTWASTSCTLCPAGYYCPSPSNVYSCVYYYGANYYSLQGSTSCTACPNSSGYYCDEQGLLNACPAGMMCHQGYAKPVPCLAGYYCQLGMYQLPCPSGTYSVFSASGITACTPVPAGYMIVASDHPPVACPTGTYNDQIGNSAGCTLCPVGYSCATASAKPSYCKPGTYASIAGLAACQTCPQGFYCSDPTVLPVNCPITSGYYSGSGYYACVLCPAGYSCIGATLAQMTACASGYYSKTGDGVCTFCPAGYQCADSSIAPLHCEAGYYSTPGSIACTICPAGHYCPYQDSLPHICPQGQFAVAGSIVCSDCPLGQVCIQSVLTATTPTVCTQSQITTQYHDACYDCPAGYACPLQLFNKIEMCGPGYYSTTSMDYCQVSMASQYAPTTQAAPTQLTAISNGYYAEIGMTYKMQTFPNRGLKTLDGRHTVACKPGWFLKNYVCTKAAAGTFAPLAWAVSGHRTAGLPCPSGTWSDAGEIECKVCPPGYDCQNQAVIPQVEESTCDPGYYQIGGNPTCIICPDAHECNNGETLAPCPVWHYADSSTVGNCLPCPDGYDCTTGVKVACAAGTYSSAQDFTCNSCPPGYRCPAGAGFPTVCAAGTYSMGGAQSCTTCPTDYYAEEGNAYCTPVPPGFYVNSSNLLSVCAHKTYSDWGDTTCTTCKDGFLCPEKTQYVTGELSCPRGYYCVAGVQTPCPAGKFGIKERATSEADGCAACPSGYNCAAGTEHFELVPCPLGAYCKDGIFASCPAGTTGDTLFGVSLNDCKTCPAGTSCGEGSTTTTTCGMAYYCPTGAAAPGYPCPAGTFGGYRSGKTDPSECLTCPPGYYCPEGTDIPIESPIGYYNPLQGIDSLDGLQICPPKFYCPNLAMTNYLGFHCVPGYYCPAGSTSATGNPCPAGTYNDRTDVHDVKDCLPCPRGYTCAAGSTSSNSNMVVCAIGQFCELGSAPSTTAIQCSAGTYSPYTKAMSQQDCLPCTPGYYCLQASSGQKITCPAGYYCPEGTQSATQYACPQGTYSTATGLVDINQCTACGVHNYCPNYAMSAPRACDAGYYNDYSVNALYCQSCQEGYYCNVGDVHPVPCPIGYYSGRGASSCTRCPLGHYCPIQGTTRTDMIANKCPAGTFCSATINSLVGGLGSYPNKEKQSNGGNACDMYYYCPEGTTTQIAITSSSYETIFIYGAGYLDQGVITPAGYTDQFQTVCPTGYYCPAGTRASSWAIKCPKGTYRLATSGMDVEDCGVCPAGYFCPTAGLTDPIICPLGMFCPEGSIRGQDCPLGTFNDVEGIKESRQCQNCPANYYCPTLGMTAVDLTLTCDQGFVCYGGALRPEPTDTTTGDICPAGAYCTSTGGLTYCAAGYIGVFQGAYDISACQLCEKGYYCFGGASGAKTCPAGYFCPAGSSGYDFTAQKPPAGYYNIAGQEAAQKCPLGTFTKVMGQSSCTYCEQGFYCHTIALADPATDAICPSGFYCLSYDTVTVSNTLPYKINMCPAGTYQAGVSMTSLSDCLDCPAGKACEQKGIALAATALPDCAAGFYCLLGASSKYPYTASGSNYGPCPVGYYCEVGTSVPTPCPAGYFSNQERAISIDYCIPCPPGFMCATAGLSQPTGPVSIGVRTADAILENQTCSTLNSQYCPLGTFIAQQCYTGYYQDVAGTGLCKECPVGQYCINGSPNVCLAGYYCP